MKKCWPALNMVAPLRTMDLALSAAPSKNYQNVQTVSICMHNELRTHACVVWVCRQTGCMRIDQSGCFPSTHKFYDVTHHGVDVMTVRFIEEQQLLLADAAADINLASPRMEYIWIIGRFDLSDGMLLAQHVIHTDALAAQTQHA